MNTIDTTTVGVGLATAIMQLGEPLLIIMSSCLVIIRCLVGLKELRKK